MIKNSQPIRFLIAFLVSWAFRLLTITAIVLYIAAPGRVAWKDGKPVMTGEDVPNANENGRCAA